MSLVSKLLRRCVPMVRLLSYQPLYVYPGTEKLNVPKQTVHSLLIEKLAANTNNTVENMMTGNIVRCPDIAEDCLRTATKFRACGIQAGDHVMVYSQNNENYIAVFVGLMSIGAIPCLANPGYTEFELSALCKHCDVKYLICGKLNRDTAKTVSNALNIPIVLTLDDLPDFIVGSDPISQVYDCDLNDTAVIGFSSGTTGLPKGVQLTHNNLNYQRAMVGNDEIFSSEFRAPQVNIMPWYHAFGFTQVAVSLEIESDIKLLTHFDPDIFLSAISKYETQLLALVPPLILFLTKHPIVDKYDLTKVQEIITGAAPLTRELVHDLQTKHPYIKNCRQGYGMTEMTAGTVFQLKGCTKLGSCGHALPECFYKVVDPDTDEVILDGSSGEILLGGPCMMKGYYNNDKANQDTMTTDGFIRSGDIGRVDKEGSLWITDRLKELIKVKAYQVAPAELEGVLISHPLIADAAVIGIPDERSGEVPKAFITPAPGSNISEEDVKKFIASKLSAEKHLGSVEFIPVIPKLPSGKILRKDLRAMEKSRQK